MSLRGHTTAQLRAVEHARRLFLDDRHEHGCAETTLVALKTALELEEPDDASPAMAFNRGVAYSGGVCGAISGAALALGLIAGRRVADHGTAKRIARELTAELMGEFLASFPSIDCRVLIGTDLGTRDQHDAFLTSGVWRDRCMRQIEFTVAWAAILGRREAWDAAVARLDTRS